mmetsp:Transcript_27663/g.69745  ORF Transcript_27663/g.69745 Transcript_27663/m.69745 type:complete len:236 (-) Transcript_27663:602-1309(-)
MAAVLLTAGARPAEVDVDGKESGSEPDGSPNKLSPSTTHCCLPFRKKYRVRPSCAKINDTTSFSRNEAVLNWVSFDSSCPGVLNHRSPSRKYPRSSTHWCRFSAVKWLVVVCFVEEDSATRPMVGPPHAVIEFRILKCVSIVSPNRVRMGREEITTRSRGSAVSRAEGSRRTIHSLHSKLSTPRCRTFARSQLYRHGFSFAITCPSIDPFSSAYSPPADPPGPAVGTPTTIIALP